MKLSTKNQIDMYDAATQGSKTDSLIDDPFANDKKDTDDLMDEGGDDEFGLGDDLTDDFGMDGGQNPMDKHQDLLKDLTNFDPYLKETFNNWLGLSWNETEGTYKSNPLIRPIMNMKGATWCLGVLKTYARRNNILTYIRPEEYKMMMGDLIENVWLNLGTRDDLGIKEDGDLIRVCNEMEHATALILMGAGDGRYSKFLGTTYSHHTNSSGEPNPNGMMPRVVRKKGAMEKLRTLLTG